MNPKEKAVRDAAGALAKAISEANANGLHVYWPHSPAGLAGIAVSETKKAATPKVVSKSADKPADKKA